MTLGEQIKQAREKKNLSQEDLAETLGVSRQAVSKWENDSSVPQGINRDMLQKVLDLEVNKKEELSNKNHIIMWVGWITASLLLIVLICVCVYQGVKTKDADSINAGVIQMNVEPALKSIQFYDSNQNEVSDEAFWYNAARIESILIQWEGGAPDSVKIFSVPSGSDTLENTELLLTKSILSADPVVLLSADVLKDIVQGHVYFELDFGGTMVTSETYNIFYDAGILTEEAVVQE